MNPYRTTFLVAACLLAAVGMGIGLGRVLPTDQLSTATRETVNLTTGLVATMAAMLLGLLVNSSKAAFDSTRARVMQKAANYALLDRVLVVYGRQAAEARDGLHSLVEAEMRRLWPDDVHVPAPAKSQNQIGNAFYLSLLKLEARDDTERALKAQAVSMAVELGQLLSLMEAESTSSISKPLLVLVVLWLVAVFLGFSLIAPAVATATAALIASAVCASGAIFLILEMDLAFSGIVRISSKPMRDVLNQLENQRQQVPDA
jgi:hypothetical protein